MMELATQVGSGFFGILWDCFFFFWKNKNKKNAWTATYTKNLSGFDARN